MLKFKIPIVILPLLIIFLATILINLGSDARFQSTNSTESGFVIYGGDEEDRIRLVTKTCHNQGFPVIVFVDKQIIITECADLIRMHE